MKRLIVLCASCLAACGDNLPPPDGVDMTYRVTVTALEDTCSDGPLSGPKTAFVDARLHADGTVELVEWSLWIPGPGAYPSIRVHEGIVDYDAQRASAYTDKVFPYRIEGALTMEAMDLELTEHWYRSPDFTDCVRRVRMHGDARGFLDPSSLDGVYEIGLSYYGEVCGTDPLPGVPLGSQVLLLDADPHAAGMYLNLDGLIFLPVSAPASDGALDWDGGLTVSTFEGYVDVDGGAHGRFLPEDVDLDVAFRFASQDAGCTYRYALKGAKRPSTADLPQNDYRVVYRVRDECEMRTEAHEGYVTLVRQSDTVTEVRDPFGAWFIPTDGADLFATDGDGGVTATFSGTATPPYIAYTVEFAYGEGGDACTYAWDVDGVVRYHPDVPWTPAFQPDPVRRADDLDP